MTFSTSDKIPNYGLNFDMFSNIRTISQTFIYSARGVHKKYKAKANTITIKNLNSNNYNLEKYLTIYSDNKYDVLFALLEEYNPYIVFTN